MKTILIKTQQELDNLSDSFDIDTISDYQIQSLKPIVLDEESYNRFLDLVENAPKPNKALLEAAQAYKK